MRKNRATRELLNSFYAVEEGPTAANKEREQNQEPSNNEHNDEAKKCDELDRKDFDVDRYLARALATLPLCDLLGEEQRLGSEARALDGEMKTLVYQNYYKHGRRDAPLRTFRLSERTLSPQSRSRPRAAASG